MTGTVGIVNYDNFGQYHKFGQIFGHNNLISKLPYKWSETGKLIEPLWLPASSSPVP